MAAVTRNRTWACVGILNVVEPAREWNNSWTSTPASQQRQNDCCFNSGPVRTLCSFVFVDLPSVHNLT